MKRFEEKTEIEAALSSISWQLKRIADSLEAIEDNMTPLRIPTLDNLPRKDITSNKLKEMLSGLKGYQENKNGKD